MAISLKYRYGTENSKMQSNDNTIDNELRELLLEAVVQKLKHVQFCVGPTSTIHEYSDHI